jgi:hypothetical protein
VRKQQPKKKRRDRSRRLMTYFKVLYLQGHVRSLLLLLWKWMTTLDRDAVIEMMTPARMSLSKNYLTDLTDRVGPWMDDRVGAVVGHADKVIFSINPDIGMIGTSKVLGK